LWGKLYHGEGGLCIRTQAVHERQVMHIHVPDPAWASEVVVWLLGLV
jgi:hypothetical protein